MTTITTIKGFTNNFLIQLNDGYLLIDTFLPTKYKRFIRNLKRKGIALKDINYLLLTHHHIDHTACVAKLREQIDFTLIVHEKAVKFLESGSNESYTKPLNFPAKIIMPIALSIFGDEYPPIKIKEMDLIIKGDKSDILKEQLGLDATIYRTPGSTEDNISIIFSDGNAITGDVVTNFLHFLGIKNQPPLITTLEEVLKSWELLIENGAKFLYPSHGRPFQINKLVKRKAKLAKKLSKN